MNQNDKTVPQSLERNELDVNLTNDDDFGAVENPVDKASDINVEQGKTSMKATTEKPISSGDGVHTDRHFSKLLWFASFIALTALALGVVTWLS